MKKIKINIKNKRRFADVALLIDKDDFIDWIQDLRRKWKIDKTFRLSDYDSFYSHIWSLGEEKAWEEFNKDIEKVRASFGRLPNFDKVILYALAFNEIPDKSYVSCYLEIIPDSADPSDEARYKYAIFVSPNTTVPDIRKVLSQFKKKIKTGLKQNFEGVEVDLTQYEFGPKHTPSPKNIDNIMRDREWYWLKEQGMSYGQIASLVNKQRRIISTDGIIKAINAYKEKLAKV